MFEIGVWAERESVQHKQSVEKETKGSANRGKKQCFTSVCFEDSAEWKWRDAFRSTTTKTITFHQMLEFLGVFKYFAQVVWRKYKHNCQSA